MMITVERRQNPTVDTVQEVFFPYFGEQDWMTQEVFLFGQIIIK